MSNQEIINSSTGQIFPKYLSSVANPTTFLVDIYSGSSQQATTPAGGAKTPITAFQNVIPGRSLLITTISSVFSSGTTGNAVVAIDYQGFLQPTFITSQPAGPSLASPTISSSVVLDIPLNVTAIRFVVIGSGVGVSDTVTANLFNATIQEIN